MSVTATHWDVGGASVRGAAHVRRDLPNQDAFAIDAARPARFVAAVSDGHGAAAHCRSDIGARLATQAALAVLNWFLDEAAPDAAVAGLPEEIVAAWRQAVGAHVAAHPLAGDRVETDWVEIGDDMLLPYGATLIAAAAIADLLVLVQIGDGDALLGYPDGRILRPLPDDAGLVGEQTYSLCGADAAARFRLVLLRGAGLPDFVMLGTDGISKSFVDETAFVAVARHYRDVARQEALAAIVPRLDGWLADVSRRGTGDDVTLCLAARKPG